MLNTQLYSGFDAFGRVIPTIAHAAQIREIYRRIGQKLQPGTEEWLASAERRGQAFDSAEMRDDLPPLLPNSGERNNSDLTAAYEKRLRGDEHSEPGYERVNGDFEGRSETTRQLGNEFRLKMVRTPQEQESMLKDFCKARGWDSDDPIARTNFELDLYYRDRLTGERS